MNGNQDDNVSTLNIARRVLLLFLRYSQRQSEKQDSKLRQQNDGMTWNEQLWAAAFDREITDAEFSIV